MAKGKLTDINFQWTPRGPAQQTAKELWKRSQIMFLVGSAGGGKTCTALGLALNDIIRSNSKLTLTRPMVFCEEATGFLPGDINAKLGPWMGPFHDVYSSLSDDGDWQKLVTALDKRLEIIPVGMMRGRTIRGVLIVDEAQGLSYAQLTCILTRLGEGGRIILCGDPSQSDKFSPQTSPLMDVCRKLDDLDTVSVVRFGPSDQQRSALVNQIIDRL